MAQMHSSTSIDGNDSIAAKIQTPLYVASIQPDCEWLLHEASCQQYQHLIHLLYTK